jgi:hypothetical protein
MRETSKFKCLTLYERNPVMRETAKVFQIAHLLDPNASTPLKNFLKSYSFFLYNRDPDERDPESL